MEARQGEITALLSDAATWTKPETPGALSSEYDALTTALEGLYAEWESLSELAPSRA